MTTRKAHIFGGILMITGTAVGAGMLALPVSTGLAGFLPATLLMIVCWLYMTYTAFLLLEVALWLPKDANVISMATHTLGKWAAGISWFVYLFLLYALTTAYIAGSGPIIQDLFQHFTGIAFPKYVGEALLLITGIVVYLGTSHVDLLNRFLMLGLAISYLLMLALLSSEAQLELLNRISWEPLLLGVSVIVTSFGFHIIIPSLCSYLEYDVRAIKKTILIGSTIPLVIYLLWQLLALSILPIEGKGGILEGYQKGMSAARLINIRMENFTLEVIVQIFSFFAIITSFLGVALSMSHFLADGLRIKETTKARIFLYSLTFFPPLIVTWVDPRAFLSALEYAGAFGVILILGLLPALMVWRGRQKFEKNAVFKTPGGKLALIAVIGFSLFVFGLELAIKLR